MIRSAFLCLVVAALAGAAVAQERPRLGVRVHPSSILVTEVEDGSVAAAGGLRRGDVIVRCGERDVETVEDVIRWLADVEEGETSIDVRRGNVETSVDLEFAEIEGERPTLGVVVTGGLSVMDVTEGSVAGAAGLEAGDVIVGFGATEVETFESLRDAIGRVDYGEEVAVRVVRDGEEVTLWAAFAEPEEEEDEPREVAPPRMPRGFPRLPGMEAFGSLMKVGSARDDLTSAIKTLKQMDDSELAAVITQLESVRDRLSQVADAVQGIKDMAGGIMGGDVDAVMGEMPDFAEIHERLQELMSEGLDLEKIQEIIAEEFPGVSIQPGGAGFEDAPPPAPKKKDDDDK